MTWAFWLSYLMQNSAHKMSPGSAQAQTNIRTQFLILALISSENSIFGEREKKKFKKLSSLDLV